MRRRLIIIGVSFALTVVVFFSMIIAERRLIEYTPKTKVLVALEDVEIGKLLNKDMFIEKDMNTDLFIKGESIGEFAEIENLYAKDRIYKGQILSKREIDTKERLKIIEIPEGMEKISIKLKSAENGVAYQIKTGDIVNIYFTGRYALIKDNIAGLVFSPAYISDENVMCTVKILEKVKILGVFDAEGRSISENSSEKIDSVVVAVDSVKANIINNLRNQGTFDITGL